MALTRDEITAGATYTVRFGQERLSSKRFHDAVGELKRIGRLEDTTAVYDGATKTWTVELPPDSNMGLMKLRILADAYGAQVERA